MTLLLLSYRNKPLEITNIFSWILQECDQPLEVVGNIECIAITDKCWQYEMEWLLMVCEFNIYLMYCSNYASIIVYK